MDPYKSLEHGLRCWLPHLKEDQTALGMVARELVKTLSDAEQLLYEKQ